MEYARGQLTSAIDIGTIGASLGIPGAVPGALDGAARLSGMDWSTGFSVGAIDKIMPGVTSKDMILHLIGDVGTAAGTGFAVEYAGSAIRALH